MKNTDSAQLLFSLGSKETFLIIVFMRIHKNYIKIDEIQYIDDYFSKETDYGKLDFPGKSFENMFQLK